MNRPVLLGLALAIALAGCLSRPEPELPEPVQVDHAPAPVADGMMGLATFSGRVLVLSRRDYPLTRADPLSAVSPTDLAVAWGQEAKSDVRDVVELHQVTTPSPEGPGFSSGR